MPDFNLPGKHDTQPGVAPIYTGRQQGSGWRASNYVVVDSVAIAESQVMVQADYIRIPGVGEFAWDATSTATRDGTTVLQITNPETLVAIAQGRWLLVSGSTISALTPAGSVAVSGVHTTTTPYLGISGGVPPFIYGRDAAHVLKFFLSTRPKALYVIGDSRSINMQLYAGKKWTNVPLGGASATSVVGPLTGVPYSMNGSANAANTLTPSAAFSGINYEDYAFNGIENICVSEDARAPSNNIWNIAQGSQILRTDMPLIVGAFDGYGVRCCWPVRLAPEGAEATRFAVQCWSNANYGTAPEFQRSAWFATYAVAPRLVRKSVLALSTATIGACISNQLVYDGGPYELGEVLAAGAPWFERSDPYGATIHDWALSGSDVEDYLGDTSYRTAGQFPDNTCADEFRVRNEHHEPMFLIDLGTNGLQIDGIWMDRAAGAASIARLIERLRYLSRSPNAPVILRSAYVTSSNLATTWWQLADLDVALQLPNVAFVDTYAMSYSIGGYPALHAAGLIGDGVHLSVPGREWLETQFNAMLVGDPIVAP